MFKSLGSKHMHSVPSGLCGYVSDEIHCVASAHGVIIIKSTIFEGFFLLLSCILLVFCVLHVALGVWRGQLI